MAHITQAPRGRLRVREYEGDSAADGGHLRDQGEGDGQGVSGEGNRDIFCLCLFVCLPLSLCQSVCLSVSLSLSLSLSAHGLDTYQRLSGSLRRG